MHEIAQGGTGFRATLRATESRPPTAIKGASRLSLRGRLLLSQGSMTNVFLTSSRNSQPIKSSKLLLPKPMAFVEPGAINWTGDTSSRSEDC